MSASGQIETYLFAGVGLEAKLSPRSCTLGFIKTYKFKEGGTQLELVYSTPCEDIPGAFGEIKGKLLAGIGATLRVYDMGLKKLLRKHENKNLNSPVVSI
jgi:splicing factor 3B subunit 3